MIAAIILLSLTGFNLLVNAYKHGEAREPFNLWSSLVATAISLTLYYFAGIFNNFK
jgi:hypothetical protein